MNSKIQNKLYNKSAISLILMTVLLSSALVGISSGFISDQSSISPFADYVTLEGVAGNDYYDTMQHSWNVNDWAAETIAGYPAADPANDWFTAEKSLRWGMTEFGEFCTPDNTGIAYGEDAAEWMQTESWASTAINPALYIQGWVFYMNYMRAGLPRSIEAYALYSDLNTVESGRKVYSWVGDRAPNALGAQLTAGSLSTSGIQVLYDSARLAVARTHVVIRDGFYNEDVAKVTFTVILNKDTKYAIVYKDVKLLIDPKVLDFINDFAFSERYEIDLARNVNPSNQAYIHWYDDEQVDFLDTVYIHPLTGDEEYDMVQAFNPGRDYIYYAAYWPETTHHAVYAPLVPDLPMGYTRILNETTSNVDIPGSIGEPNTPWVIAQWRYNSTDYPKLLQFLAKSANREIRFVEVAGMTDYNWGDGSAQTVEFDYDDFRAKDVDAGDGVNVVDTEVRYLLNNVFNPEDLTEVGEDSDPFMWIGLGQSAATTDSGSAAVMSDFNEMGYNQLSLFDRNDTAFPWINPVVGMKGTIPFALSNTGNFAPNYLETFSNDDEGTGDDDTEYKRTGLNGFAFNYYDEATSARSPPQPIAGGKSLSGTTATEYWYPSEDPLFERFISDSTWTAFTPDPYIDWTDPNGIISLGGMKANGITRYFNDFGFAISREGASNYALVNGGSVSGMAPTSDGSLNTLDYFPLSTWASSMSTFNYKDGYAVISLANDINGTRGLSIYGWDGRDTYWAAAWASQYCGTFNSWIPAGTVSLILKINYSTADREPTSFTVVKALGTITEFGANAFIDAYGDFDELEHDWTGSFADVLPEVPLAEGDGVYLTEWWYEKLYTTSTAKVDFDP